MTRDHDHETALCEMLSARFGERVEPPEAVADCATLRRMAARASCRRFRPTPPDLATLRALAAVALSAPTKSDLQSRDIVIVSDPALKADVLAVAAHQPWTAGAPALLVFCGENRRQRRLHALRGRPFANDHLDAFFNAAVDAGIALSAFVTAAEAIGLGCCPISALRDQPDRVSDLLGLPKHVFPVAGLAVGAPAEPRAEPAMRLPLSTTLHVDRWRSDDLDATITTYDAARAARQPYAAQRRPDLFGESAEYGWSEDKARQYALPERADFGAFIRRKGFKLD
jgi:nitroreductase/FMN reductase [NAD(P)H]